jgi:hypothetical protein
MQRFALLADVDRLALTEAAAPQPANGCRRPPTRTGTPRCAKPSCREGAVKPGTRVTGSSPTATTPAESPNTLAPIADAAITPARRSGHTLWRGVVRVECNPR